MKNVIWYINKYWKAIYNITVIIYIANNDYFNLGLSSLKISLYAQN